MLIDSGGTCISNAKQNCFLFKYFGFNQTVNYLKLTLLLVLASFMFYYIQILHIQVHCISL